MKSIMHQPICIWNRYEQVKGKVPGSNPLKLTCGITSKALNILKAAVFRLTLQFDLALMG